MWESFAVQKILTFFQQKIAYYCDIYFQNFNESLTNDVVNFEQPALDLFRVWTICKVVTLTTAQYD